MNFEKNRLYIATSYNHHFELFVSQNSGSANLISLAHGVFNQWSRISKQTISPDIDGYTIRIVTQENLNQIKKDWSSELTDRDCSFTALMGKMIFAGVCEQDFKMAEKIFMGEEAC